MRCWSMSTALIGAVRCASAWSSSLERQRQRIGSEAALVGVELDRAEPARIAQHEVAAVGEVHAEAVPLRHAAVARVHQRVARLLVVDEHATAHAEVHADAHVGIARVEHDLLARGGVPR